MPDPTAPVTGDLRERVAFAVLRFHGRENEPTDTDLALAKGTADAVIAELAGDAGDMPKRMAEALHAADCGCDGGPDGTDLLRAEAAMRVRDEHTAHIVARMAAAEAAVERVREDAREQQRQTGTTADRWKLGVYAQASRTLQILTALDASDGTESTCPTPCDDDCEAGPSHCAEIHVVRWQRGHQPEDCPGAESAEDA